jgi:hypothetical protein
MMKHRIGLQTVTVFLLAMISFAIVTTPSVHATPPTEIVLEYNLSTQILWVNATHEVPNPQNHHIELIEVFKNDVFQINRTYDVQTANYGLNDTFVIAASDGDNLTVTVTCSRSDSLTNWIVVGSSSTTSSTTSTSTGTTQTSTSTGTTQTATEGEPLEPAAFMIIALIVVAAIVLMFACYQSGNAQQLQPVVDRIKAGFGWLRQKVGSAFDSIRGRLSRNN